MTSTSDSRAVLSDLADRLRRHYGPRLERIVLFGSRARGEAADDSDFDVLVVLAGPVDPRRERRETRDLVYSLCLQADAVLSCHYVPSARYRHERSPLMLNVRREGVTV
jgi:uncharacterized protein